MSRQRAIHERMARENTDQHKRYNGLYLDKLAVADLLFVSALALDAQILAKRDHCPFRR